MAPIQRNVYIAVREWWSLYHFGPTYEDIRFCLMYETAELVEAMEDDLALAQRLLELRKDGKIYHAEEHENGMTVLLDI